MPQARTSRLFRDSRGATAIEYAVIALLIGLGLVSALRSVKSNVAQQIDTASYNMNQSTGGTTLAVRRVFAATTLTENGILYSQQATQYYPEGKTVCPCLTTYVRTPVNAANAPYQKATFEYDTSNNLIGITQNNNDGSTAIDKVISLYQGVTFVQHQDSTGSYTYREQSSTTNGIVVATRTVVDDSGTAPFKTLQYVQDNSVSGVSSQIGAVQTNRDGTVTRTGKDISSYF